MTAVTSQTPLQSVRMIASDIKLAHSIFALPFALLAAFMATTAADAVEWNIFKGQLIFIVLAMVFARTCAMLANRILDRKFDSLNPRTAGRAIPSGKLPVRNAIVVWVCFAALFMLMCFAFYFFLDNPWPIILSLPVLLWISAYALFKRFTWLCHLYLGSSLAISPLAAALAINPDALLYQPALWLLSAMLLCWVAGFDIIYALQDIDVDCAQNLHSIPQRFGFGGALRAARILHLIAAIALITAAAIDERFGFIFADGVVIVLALLVYEHATVARWGTTKIALAFFTLNGVISCVLGAIGIVDVII